MLAEIKDSKDKILTKLYKRRVELDFSRKGSSAMLINNNNNNNNNKETKDTNSTANISHNNARTIAAALTCCRYCGSVYLDTHSSSLHCKASTPSIDHRGRLFSRHAAIIGWSLTAYLKSLHAGGMAWDSIYWHVWAACIVLRCLQDDQLTISALETDRYHIEPDALIIKRFITNNNNHNNIQQR